jgi:hypothetical protein
MDLFYWDKKLDVKEGEKAEGNPSCIVQPKFHAYARKFKGHSCQSNCNPTHQHM